MNQEEKYLITMFLIKKTCPSNEKGAIHFLYGLFKMKQDIFLFVCKIKDYFAMQA
jgi:hypothetical protein